MFKKIMQFIGTGAGEGVPTPLCRCRICENARKVGGKEIRLRSSFRVSNELMIDMGPDVLASCAYHGIDLFDLEHLIITHTHEDHFNIFNFSLKPMTTRGNGKPLNVYLNGDAYKFIDFYRTMPFDGDRNFVDDYLKDIKFHQLSFYKEFQIADCLITPIKGEHHAHFEKNSANYYIVLPDGTKMVYALDTGFYGEETLAFLKDKQVDIFIVEGTFGSCDRGERPYSHLDLRSDIALCDALYTQNTLTNDSKVFLTHLNQEQEFTHEEMCEFIASYNRPYTITVAFDGMTI